MDYLIFDIECSDGQHICEFGFVKFDEQFNILQRDCITINPEKPFKLSGRFHDSDMSLAFSKERYLNSPSFPKVYEKIKGIIEQEGVTIIGFSMHNDAGFLATATERYNLPMINFKYYDLQKLYKSYSKSKNVTSIKHLVELLGISDVTLHKSDDDSFATMKILKAICEKENLSVADTLSLLLKSHGSFEKEMAKEKTLSLIDRVNAGNKNAKKEYALKFAKKLKVNKSAKQNLIKGKKVCVSYYLQKTNFNLYLALVKKIFSLGAIYTANATECQVFVVLNKPSFIDVRQRKAEEVNAFSSSITFIELEDFLKEFGCTEKELTKVNYVNKKYVK